MTINQKAILGVSIVIFILSAFFLAFSFYGQHLFAAVNEDTTTPPEGHFIRHPFFTSTSTSATSTTQTTNGILRIAGAKAVNLYFSRGNTVGLNTGTSTFLIQVTNDGDNWYDFNKLLAGTTTNSVTGHPEHWGSISIEASTSTVVAAMDLTHDAFYAIRCIVRETINGTHSCSATAEF
jgi:hypothetical protein